MGWSGITGYFFQVPNSNAGNTYKIPVSLSTFLRFAISKEKAWLQHRVNVLETAMCSGLTLGSVGIEVVLSRGDQERRLFLATRLPPALVAGQTLSSCGRLWHRTQGLHGRRSGVRVLMDLRAQCAVASSLNTRALLATYEEVAGFLG